MSCPYTPAQNGQDERKHQDITETSLTMLFHSHVPLRFWVDAFSTTAFIINQLPTPTFDGLSPFEILYNKSPTYSNFHPFGCLVFSYLRDYAPHKLSPRSRPCVFLGYSMSHHDFYCLDCSTNHVFISRHAIFYELIYPFQETSCSRPLLNSLVSAFLESASIPVAELPTRLDPVPRSCGSCLTDPSVSFVPLSGLQAPTVESIVPLIYKRLLQLVNRRNYKE
jgi:histone deacetylase 1/2